MPNKDQMKPPSKASMDKVAALEGTERFRQVSIQNDRVYVKPWDAISTEWVPYTGQPGRKS